MNPKVDFLRHSLATLDYRLNQALKGAPDSFAEFDGAGKTPLQILSHMCDLLDWGASFLEGEGHWHASKPTNWEMEKKRFGLALQKMDELLQKAKMPEGEAEKLFQGPVADALTHTGQIAMIRRMAGSAIPGQNYYRAKIEVKRAGTGKPIPAHVH